MNILDQLRTVLNQVGGDAKEMQAAMSQAFKQIVVGFVDVAKALGTFVVGAFNDAGRSILDFSLKLFGADEAMKRLTESSPRLASLLTSVIGGALGFVVASVGVAIAAFIQLDKEQTQIAKSSTLLGASMGLTMDSTRSFAEQLGYVSGNTTKATQAILAMAEVGGFTSKQIETIGFAAMNLERSVGVPVEETVKQFKKLAEEPTKALTEVAKSTGFVSAETVKMVAELEDSGRKSEAAALAIKAYADATKQAADTVKQNYGYLETVAKTTGEFFSSMWDKILGVGRTQAIDTQIKTIQARIKEVSTGGILSGIFTEQGRSNELQVLNAELAALQKQQQQMKSISEERSKQAKEAGDVEKQMKAYSTWKDKFSKEELTRQEYINKSVEDYNKKLEGAAVVEEHLLDIQRKAGKEWDKAHKQKKPKVDNTEANAINALWESITDSVNKANVAYDEVVNGSEKYTSSQKKMMDIVNNKAFLAMPESLQQEALARLAVAHATEEQTAKAKALQKSQDDEIDQITKQFEALTDLAKARKLAFQSDMRGYADKLKLVEEESEDLLLQKKIYGQATEQQKIAIEYAKVKRDLEKEILKIKEKQAKGEYSESQAKEAIDAQEKIAEAKRKNILDASALETYKAYHSAFANAIETGLFESGKTASKDLRDFLEQELLRKPFRVFINAVVDAALGTITGKGTNNLLSTGSSLTNALGLTSNTGVFGSMFSGASAYGSAIGGSAAAGSQAAMLAAQTGEFGLAGLAATTEAAGGAMAGLAGAANSTISALSAAAPWLLGGVAVLSLINSMDNSGTYHTGGLGAYSKSGGTVAGSATGLAFGLSEKDITVSGNKASSAIAESIVSLLDQTASAFGKEAGYYAATAFADDTSDDGAWGALMVKLGDKVITDWADNPDADKNVPKIFADGKAGAEEYANAIAGSVKQVIDKMGLPEWTTKLLSDIGETPSIEELSKVMQEIADFPNKLLETAGTSRDTLVDTFKEGLMEGDTSAAGIAVADALISSIEDSMFGFAAGQIFDIVNQGIVTPMLDALITGQSVSEALSQSSIDAVISKATATAQALGAIYNDPVFQEALTNIRTTVGTALGGAASNFNYTPKYQPPKEVKDAKDNVSKEEKDATDAAKKLADSLKKLNNDSMLLTAEYNDLINGTKTVKKVTRDLAIEGMSELEIAAYDANEALRDKIELYKKEKQALDDFWSAVERNLSKFMQGDDLRFGRSIFLAQDLNKAGVGTGNPMNDARTLMQLSTKQIRELASAFVLSAENSVEAKTAVLDVAGALIDLADAAANEALKSLVDFYDMLQSNAEKATDKAFAVLEKSISSLIKNIEDEQKAIEESIKTKEKAIDSIKEVFDVLKNSAAALYNSVTSTNKAEVNKASKFISDALLTALQTGVLPDAKDLEKAIGLVTADLDATQFKTKFDADKQRILLANMLSEFQSLADDQLTDAQKQLAVSNDQLKELENLKIAAQDQLEYWKKQVDIQRDTWLETIGVKEAINALATALGVEAQVKADAAKNVIKGVNGGAYDINKGTGVNSSGTSFVGSEVRDATILHLTQGGTAQQIYDVIKSSGFSLAQAETILGATPGSFAAEAAKMGLPTFADGGMHSGGIRLVGEEGPELEVTGPARYYSANQTASMLSGNSDKEELEMLRYEVRAVAQHSAKLTRTIERLIVGTNDGEALQTKAVV